MRVQVCRLLEAKPLALGSACRRGRRELQLSTPRAASAHWSPCPSTSGQRWGPRWPGGCTRFHPAPQGQAAKTQPARETELEAPESQSKGLGPLKRGVKEEEGICLPGAAEGPGQIGPARTAEEFQGGRWDLDQSRLGGEVGPEPDGGDGFEREQEGTTGRKDRQAAP